MAQAGINYITREGDRWDLIAWNFYGDPMRYSDLILANAHVPIVPVLRSGIVITVPLIVATKPAPNIPVWKRL